MKFNSKTAVILSLMILLAAVLSVYSVVTNKPKTSSPIADKTQAFPVLPAATGSISDTLKAFNSSASSEQTIAKEGEDDANLITSDSKEISDFGQSYQENDF